MKKRKDFFCQRLNLQDKVFNLKKNFSSKYNINKCKFLLNILNIFKIIGQLILCSDNQQELSKFYFNQNILKKNRNKGNQRRWIDEISIENFNLNPSEIFSENVCSYIFFN